MADVLQFRPKTKKVDKRSERMLGFSSLIDKLVIKALFDLQLTPEEIVAVLANRTRAAAESCFDVEKVKEFAAKHIKKAF